MASQSYPWLESSIAPDPCVPGQTFRVTHPFHPLYGRELVLLTSVRRWGEDRVYFQDDQGRAVSLRAQWTSLFTPPPVVALSAGRSAFCAQDLRELARLLQGLKPKGKR